MHPQRILLFFPAYFFFIVRANAGNEYFQQETDYVMHVSLNDKNHTLDADENIRYTNHSPDTLLQIYFHLWPNAYRNDRTALSTQLMRSGENRFGKLNDDDFGSID